MCLLKWTSKWMRTPTVFCHSRSVSGCPVQRAGEISSGQSHQNPDGNQHCISPLRIPGAAEQGRVGLLLPTHSGRSSGRVWEGGGRVQERQRGWEDTEFWIAERGVVSGCLCNGKRQYSSGCARPSAYSSGISDCFFQPSCLSLCAHLLAHGVHSDWLTPELPKAANPEGAWKARWEGIRQHPSAMEETVFV